MALFPCIGNFSLLIDTADFDAKLIMNLAPIRHGSKTALSIEALAKVDNLCKLRVDLDVIKE